MINYIWSFLIILGIFIGCIQGNIMAVSNSILEGSKEAIELCILMFGIVGLWSGIMNVAISLNIVKPLRILIHPIIKRILPDKNCKEAYEFVSVNIVSNILGLGWAATPSGIQAMIELNKSNPHPKYATNSMCNFVILNVSSLQLIPINIIAYRNQYGSANPSEIIIPGLIATSVSTITAILFCIAMGKEKE